MSQFSLQPGDVIGVFAPSSYVEESDIEAAKAFIEKRGYQVFVHPQTYARYPKDSGQSAGSHKEKLNAMHTLYADPKVKMIWAAGGGNRALHLLEGVNYSILESNRKPMVGFSDVTALLNAITYRTGIRNVHGQVFKNLPKHKELDDLIKLLSGQGALYYFSGANILTRGKASGPLFGGNLSVFQYLPQILGRDLTQGTILFLEDCNEELSRIDRMFLHLKRVGVLDQISGLMLGEFCDLQDTGRPFGLSLEDIISEHTSGLKIPIVMNVPFGHGANLCPLPVGQNVILDTTNQQPALILQRE